MSRLTLVSLAMVSLSMAVLSVALGIAFAFNRYAVGQFLLADESGVAHREAVLAQRLASQLAPLEAGFHYQEAFFLGPELCRQSAKTCDAQLALLRESIRLRPYWPFGWLRYAEACSARGDLACSLAALRHAWRYGENERKVRQAALRIGLQHWALLDADDRSFLRRVVERVRHRDARLFQQAVDETGSGELLPMLTGDGPEAEAARGSVAPVVAH